MISPGGIFPPGSTNEQKLEGVHSTAVLGFGPCME